MNENPYEIPVTILRREVEIAFGNCAQDKECKTLKSYFYHMVYGDKAPLGQFTEGEKDGPFLLQGGLVGGRRIAKNVTRNHLMMFDHDTGESIKEIAAKIKKSGLFAILWTTYNHMVAKTAVSEVSLLQWLKRKKLPSDVIGHEQVVEYLKETKNVRPEILDVQLKLDRVQLEGGVRYVLHHAPMPRVRSLFVLKEPFDFAQRGNSQDAAILEWKERYAGLAAKLGVSWDRSCVDPSRLMYLPRVAPGTTIANDGVGHGIYIVNENDAGELLDIDSIPRTEVEGKRPNGALPDQDAFKGIMLGEQRAEINDSALPPLKTPDLAQFLREHVHDFQAADFMHDHEEGGIRHDYGDHYDFCCPNEDAHSNPSPTDRAFMVYNASDHDSGKFVMSCRHETCQNASRGYKGWYLDQACQKYEIKHASELLAWCTDVRDAEIKEQEHKDALQDAISKLTPQTSAADIDVILTELAKRKQNAVTRALLNEIIEKTGWRRPDVDKAFTAALKEIKQSSKDQDGAEGDSKTPPDNPAKANIIWEHWTHTDKKRCSIGRFVSENAKNPFVFQRKTDNSIIRIINGAGRITLDNMDRDKWAEELEEHMLFMRASSDGGPNQDIPAFPDCVRAANSGRDMGFPVLDRVIQIPVFGPDGTLRWEKGYHSALQHYINPNLECRPVPGVVTMDDVDEAACWLQEAIIDFPFSDAFDGADMMPQYTDELDEDGWRVPNYDRGRSSRANFIALILQPIVRGMIDGPCPAYHIDKSAPGTGAGYLANVVHVIINGDTAVAQPMSDQDEELRKTITASLVDGAHIIFLDNINHRVASGHLAAALTAGVWKDRLLGYSRVVEVPNSATWILAGNNLHFSHELMRRNVPIRIDANVPNPAQDRKAGDFKYTLTPWLKENRANLLWSCHVLGRWWVQNGMPAGSKRIHSFDSWSNVMSGIMETAGIRGFLDNIENYLGNKDEDENTFETFAQHLFGRFGDTSATVAEMYKASLNPVTGNFMFELPINGNNEHAQMTSLGKVISNSMSGRTFKLDDQGLIGKLLKVRPCNPAVYQWRISG